MRSRIQVEDFDSLLSPVTRETFFLYYGDKLPFFIDASGKKAAADLVDRDAISAIVRQGIQPDRRIAMYRAGAVISPALYETADTNPRIESHRIRTFLSEGASLVINGVDELIPRIGALAESLEREVAANVWANVYITTGDAGALDLHFDDHDVLVLQVRGTKRWRLQAPDQPHPLHPGESLGTPPESPEQLFEMSEGDVLLVPRGFWHRTEVLDSPAIHLSFGMGGVTGLDALRLFVADLAAEPLARKYVPVAHGLEAIEAHETALKALVRRALEHWSLREQLRSGDAERRVSGHPPLWGSIDLDEHTKLTPGLRRKGATEHVLSYIEEGIELQLAGTARRAIELVLARPGITFGELCETIHNVAGGVSYAQLKDIAVSLIERGVVGVDGPRSDTKAKGDI